MSDLTTPTANTAKLVPILFVDDEPLVLAGYRRMLGRSFNITLAEGGAKGLAAIEAAAAAGTTFPVILTDMRMPQMNGIDFIAAARAKSKDSIFIMLTGNADQQTAVDAINRGHIFRFLNKPCPTDQLEGAIRAAARQYELVTAERVLLRDTFTGSVKFMSEALELANPELYSLQAAVKQTMQQACATLGVRFDWQLYVASTLSLVGLITVPARTNDGQVPEDDLAHAAVIGSKLLGHLPRIGPVVAMIAHQRDAELPMPNDLKTPDADGFVALGAQLIRFSIDLAQEERRTGDRAEALRRLAASSRYDPRLTEAFLATATSTVGQAGAAAVPPVAHPVAELREGMVVAQDVLKPDGSKLVTSGEVLSELAVVSLRNFADRKLIDASILIRPTAGSGQPAAAAIAA